MATEGSLQPDQQPQPPPPSLTPVDPSIASTVSSARSSMLDRDSMLSEATVSTISTTSSEDLELEASDVLPDPTFYKQEASHTRHPVPKRMTPRISSSQRIANSTSQPGRGPEPMKRPVPAPLPHNLQERRSQNGSAESLPAKRSYSGATPAQALELARQQVTRTITHHHIPRSPMSPRHIPKPGDPLQRSRTMPSMDQLPSRSKKSQKDLEKLCDEDGDDLVLDDDMALFNVPMSPSLLPEGATSFPDLSRASKPDSLSPNLSRASSSTTPRNMHRSPNSRYPPSRSPSGHRLASMPEGPREPDDPKPRTKSWELAHAALSVEAKALALALESHEHEAKGALKSESTPTLPSENSNETVFPASRPSQSRRSSWWRRGSSNSLELINGVPVPTPSAIEDNLPPSEEKKALMSFTRPTWLPPKSKKEEEKHLKEYQRMMAQSIEADRLSKEKVEMQRRSRDEDKQSLAAMWTNIVLPGWDDLIRDKRSRQLRWKGIPAALRPHVWSRIIGNKLRLSVKHYQAALLLMEHDEQEVISPSLKIPGQDDGHTIRRRVFREIDQELEKIFSTRKKQTVSPRIGFETEKWEPEHRVKQLRRVLMAYVTHRSDQVIDSLLIPIAATLLLAMSPASITRPDAEQIAEATAFIQLCNLTASVQPRAAPTSPTSPGIPRPRSPSYGPSRSSSRSASARFSASPNTSMVSLPIRAVSNPVTLPSQQPPKTTQQSTPTQPVTPFGPPLDLLLASLTADEATKTTYYNAILGVLKLKSPNLHSHLISVVIANFGGEVAVWLETLVGTLCSAPCISPTISWTTPTLASMVHPHHSPLQSRGRSGHVEGRGQERQSDSADPPPPEQWREGAAVAVSGPPDIAVEKLLRLWDVVLFEGDNAIIRACVARLMELESKLLQCERGWEVRDLLLDRKGEERFMLEDEEEELRKKRMARAERGRVRSETIAREGEVEKWMALVKEAGKV